MWGADDVVGIKTTINEFGNRIQFMASCTAVVKTPGVKPITDSLPAQAIVRDQETAIHQVGARCRVPLHAHYFTQPD